MLSRIATIKVTRNVMKMNQKQTNHCYRTIHVCMNQVNLIKFSLPRWPRVITRVSCAEGLEFKSQTGQILHSVANGSPPLQHLRV